MLTIDPNLIAKLHKPAPRYTSYPTAPTWSLLPDYTLEHQLNNLTEPLSLYCHIPFCQTMCLYCGCSVILNRKAENEQRYVHYLQKELSLIAKQLPPSPMLLQLHFGGGTPTKLTELQLTQLMQSIHQHFTLDHQAEIAMEIDPRTVVEDNGKKLHALKALGFNRVSFGVQDTDPLVQKAVKRHQSLEMTLFTYELAKTLGFASINIDLIYGLPYQTPASFAKTTQHILSMRPDRISLFSYAKVPWLKPHQKAIKDSLLPSLEAKFQIYCQAREAFIQAGYVALGMDHFALPDDPISKAYEQKTLARNFQGYTLAATKHLIGLGVTSIGYVDGCYTQNAKDLGVYYDKLEAGILPVIKGKQLSVDDQIRKWVIHTLMCQFELDKAEFERRFSCTFDSYFPNIDRQLALLVADGLLICEKGRLHVTSVGQLFVRNIAMQFDAYLESVENRFSASV